MFAFKLSIRVSLALKRYSCLLATRVRKELHALHCTTAALVNSDLIAEDPCPFLIIHWYYNKQHWDEKLFLCSSYSTISAIILFALLSYRWHWLCIGVPYSISGWAGHTRWYSLEQHWKILQCLQYDGGRFCRRAILRGPSGQSVWLSKVSQGGVGGVLWWLPYQPRSHHDWHLLCAGYIWVYTCTKLPSKPLWPCWLDRVFSDQITPPTCQYYSMFKIEPVTVTWAFVPELSLSFPTLSYSTFDFKPKCLKNESTAGADASVEVPKLHNIKLY